MFGFTCRNVHVVASLRVFVLSFREAIRDRLLVSRLLIQTVGVIADFTLFRFI